MNLDEEKIANKIKPKLYPQYNSKEAYWECYCGRKMIAKPFGDWKKKIVNHMFKLRKHHVKEMVKSIENKRRTDNNDYIEFSIKDWMDWKKEWMGN